MRPVLTLALICGTLGLLGLGIVVADARHPGDGRCYVAETALRQVQSRSIDEALAVLRADLEGAKPGASGMLLVRGCR